jgi:hypothetical protein
LLWRGEPLADAGSELLPQRAVPYLAEIRLQAWETRLEATDPKFGPFSGWHPANSEVVSR